MSAPKLKAVPKAKSVRLAYGDIGNDGEFLARTRDGRAVTLRKMRNDLSECIAPGAPCYFLGGGLGRPPAVNAVSVEPGKDGKHVFFYVPLDFVVTFFPKYTH